MTNQPDRFSLFMLGPNEKRVEIQEETSIENAATVILNKEDHTLGNLLRHAVLAVPGVLFCGYKVPHPLEPRVLLKIQTDGNMTPVQALQSGCERLISQIGQIRNSWKTEVQLKAPPELHGPSGISGLSGEPDGRLGGTDGWNEANADGWEAGDVGHGGYADF